MGWGSSPWGYYPWGADWADLTGSSGFEGELEIGYGEKASGSTGSLLADYEFLLTGQGGSDGVIGVDVDAVLAGQSGSEGELDYATISALSTLVCLVMNALTERTYEYDNYGFKGFGRFNQVFMGVMDDGIYDLETSAEKDGSTDIDAYVTFETDFGTSHFKHIRMIELDGGRSKVSITDQDGDVHKYSLDSAAMQGIRRTIRDRSLRVKFENINGERITVHGIMGNVNIIEKKGG